MNLEQLCCSYPSVKEYMKALPDELVKAGVPVSINKGSIVVFRGDTLKYAYIILKGEMGIVYDAKEGKSHLYNNLTPFKIISDIEVLAEESQYCSTVIAEKASILFRIPIQAFRRSMQTCPEFANEVIHTFASCAYRISMKRGFQAYGSAAHKLAIHFLMGAMTKPPTEEKPYIVEKTRQTLAEELELSVKTINRCIDTLKAEGYLVVLNRKIFIERKHFDKMTADFL